MNGEARKKYVSILIEVKSLQYKVLLIWRFDGVAGVYFYQLTQVEDMCGSVVK